MVECVPTMHRDPGFNPQHGGAEWGLGGGEFIGKHGILSKRNKNLDAISSGSC